MVNFASLNKKFNLSYIYWLFLNVALFIFLFFFIYSIPFNFLPFGIGTRVMIAFLGGALVLLKIIWKLYKRQKIFIPKWVFYWFISVLFFTSVSLSSVLFNSSYDLGLVKYSISLTLIFLGGYFLKSLFRFVYKQITFIIIAKFILSVVSIQLFISVLMFFNPILREFLYSIQNFSSLELAEEFSEFRLIGFGSAFFTAGIINGYSLLILASVIRYSKINLKFFLLVFFFVLILAIGMMMARITIIGGILGILLFLWPSKFVIYKISKKVIFFVSYLILIPLIIFGIFSSQQDENKVKVEAAYKYGFELFINYFTEGELKTASTDDLKESYKLPKHIKTYLIGDGKFVDPANPLELYYMGVDAGYLRLLFCSGIIGILSYFLTQLLPLIDSGKRYPIYFMFFMFSGLYFLILNFKGFTDILPYSILFCFSSDLGTFRKKIL